MAAVVAFDGPAAAAGECGCSRGREGSVRGVNCRSLRGRRSYLDTQPRWVPTEA